ncbi:MAG: hypothetical protein IJI66_03035 [Erysipelotrichaceae bacterium]|nr:hypothetical protein [Erysipelotrichaceae bacterium]
MQIVNNNVTPSVTVCVRTPDDSIKKEFVCNMSYAEEKNMYHSFKALPSEEWADIAKVREILDLVEAIWTGDKNKIISFNFDHDFIENAEKEDEMSDYIDTMLAIQNNNTEDDIEEWFM